MNATKVKILSIPLAFVIILLLPFDHLYSMQKLRLGYLQSDLLQLAAFVALEKGFFQQGGVHITIGGIFKAGPEEMTAFASGELVVLH